MSMSRRALALLAVTLLLGFVACAEARRAPVKSKPAPGKGKENDKVAKRIDEPAVQKMLQAVAVPTMTMQSMVFEPANRVMWWRFAGTR